jgi:hypothetical protein
VDYKRRICQFVDCEGNGCACESLQSTTTTLEEVRSDRHCDAELITTVDVILAACEVITEAVLAGDRG